MGIKNKIKLALLSPWFYTFTGFILVLLIPAVALSIKLNSQIFFETSGEEVVAVAPPTPSSNPQVAGVTTATSQIDFSNEKLYLLINAYRKDHKLSPLSANSLLEKSSQLKIGDMIKNKYYRHEDLQNIQSWYLFKQVGYNFINAGENLSFSYNTPWQVFDAWTNSPTHNEQLLNSNYQDMGVASDCVSFQEYADGGCIVVLHLGKQ